MITPTKSTPEPEPVEDDLGLELEDDDAKDVLGGDEKSFEPEGDDDLDLDDAEEVIGLDSPNGLDEEPNDDDEVDDEEEGSWLDETLAEELGADDDSDDDGERWTEGSDPVGDEGFDDDLDLSDEPGAGIDSGDEGFADEQLLTGLDVEALPALDPQSDEEDGSDPIERELLDELVAAAPEEAAGSAPSTVVELPWVRLREGGSPTLLAATGELCASWDVGLWLALRGEVVAKKVSAPGPVAHALVLSSVANGGARGTQLAIATPGGVCVSRDGGRTFGPPLGVGSAGTAPSYLAFTRDPGGAVLWAAAPFGQLHVLREGGDELVDAGLELPVAKLVSDGALGLLVVGRSDDGALRAVSSRDGGRSFKPLALPADAVERVQALAVAGETWLCSRRGLKPQLLWGRAGEAGSPIGASATPPVALLIERGVACAYLCDGATLLRVELHSGKPLHATLLGRLPGDLGTPLQLSACSDAQGHPLLHLVGTRALYRVSLQPPAPPPAASDE